MELYHGSTVCVSSPQLLPCARRLDFGSGFYTTTDREQASRWAVIKKRRLLAENAIVSTFDSSEFDSLQKSGFLVKCFTDPSDEWLDFVMLNRLGDSASSDKYDVIREPVANDTLYETLALFERGILTRAETVVRLKTHALADQVVFATERALTALRFIECREVSL